MTKYYLILIGLFHSFAFANDDPDHDEPRTALMDYQVVHGEIAVGEDFSGSPSVYGELSYNQVTSHFNWNGILDVSVPIESLINRDAWDWKSIDVIAGGRWVMNTWHSEPADQQFGIGVEVQSYERSKPVPALDPSVNLPEGLDPGDVIRMSLRGVLATLGWTTLTQKQYESSETLDVAIGVGVGSFGVDVSRKGSSFITGGIIHARIMTHIMESQGVIQARFSWAESFGRGDALEGSLSASLRLFGHWKGTIGLEVLCLEHAEKNWKFEPFDESTDKNFLQNASSRVIFGLGYEF